MMIHGGDDYDDDDDDGDDDDDVMTLKMFRGLRGRLQGCKP